MDSSRAGEGVANGDTSGWKSVEFRKKIVREIANAIIANCPRTVTCNISHVMALAKRVEEKVNASAKDEADYNSKIRSRIMSMAASSQVHGPKPLAAPSNLSEASSSSVSKQRVADVDWQEELFQRVQTLRSVYLTVLSNMYKGLVIRLKQNAIPYNIKSASFKKALEEIITCLNVTKSEIDPDFKSKLDEKEGQIRIILTRRSKDSPDDRGPHSTDESSIQQTVPSQSRVSQDKLSGKQLTLPSMSVQISHLSEQIPDQNRMNPQVKSEKSELYNPEKLMQKVAKECSISQKHETPLPAGTFDQPNQAIQRLVKVKVVKECSISQKHETPLPAVTFDQPSPAVQRLFKVVSSMSQKSLSESAGEIRDIVSLCDISSAPFKRPKNVIGSNSVVDLSADSHAGYAKFGHFPTRGRKIRRCHNARPLHTASLYASMPESLNPLTDADESDLNSARPQVKWPINEEKHALIEEIKEVNKLLLDTNVVINEADIISNVAAGASGQGDGLIVVLYFTGVTVSLDPMFHLVSNQKSIIEPLRLLIPTSYPICSPILLGEMPAEFRDKPDDLSMRAKRKLQVSLQSLTHPLSIKNIAMSWETCVREAICDCAQNFGGGTFSSKYGGWEKC